MNRFDLYMIDKAVDIILGNFWADLLIRYGVF